MFYQKRQDYEPTEKVTLATIVFQTFVMLQLFNQINSRKVAASFPIKCGCYSAPNWTFWGLWVLTLGAQLLVVQYGGRYMRVVPLTW